MSDPLLTVSAAGLRAAGVSLTPAEAVACVILAGDALEWASDAPDAGRLILRGDGRIEVQGALTAGDTSARVASYARLLHRLLPDPGSDAGQTPGALRLTVARALGAIDAPPFARVHDFRTAIERFLTHAPEEHVVAAVVRWAEAMGAQADERLPERRVAGPRVDTLRRMLREADLERYALVSAAPPDAPRVEAVVAAAEVETDATEAEDPQPRVLASYAAVPERRVRWGAFAAVALLAAVVGWAAATLARDSGRLFPDSQPARHAASPAPPPRVQDDVGSAVSSSQVEGTTGRGAASAPAVESSGGTPHPAADSASAATGAAVPERASVERVPDAAADVAAKASVGGDERPLEPPHWPSGTDERTVIDAGMVTYSGFRLANVIDGEHHTGHVRLSPNGERVAFDSDRDGERGIYVAARDGTGVKRVSGAGYARAPSWAPDSRRLAFLRAEPDDARVRNLWLLNLDTGEERRITAWRYGETSGSDWFPDGRRLSYAHDGRLYVMDLATGASRSYESPVGGRGIKAVAVAPEGERVAFHVVEDGVWLLDLATGSTRRVLQDPTIEQLAWSPTGTSLAYHSRSAGHWAVLVLGGG